MKKITILFLITFLFGCSTLEKADKIIISGQAEKVIFNIEYTQTEREVIQKAIAKYNAFHERWKGFIENPVQLSALGNAKLMSDYQDIKNAYIALEYVVSVNYQRYNEETQKQLLKFQDMAYDYDKTMGRIKTVSDVAAYSALVSRLATAML